MPLEISDFPDEVQEAFFIYNYLEDKWEGMSGSYMGKHWGSVHIFFDMFKVRNKNTVLFFMKTIERHNVALRAEESNRERKARERKAKAGSNKNYTHNVRG